MLRTAANSILLPSRFTQKKNIAGDPTSPRLGTKHRIGVLLLYLHILNHSLQLFGSEYVSGLQWGPDEKNGWENAL